MIALTSKIRGSQARRLSAACLMVAALALSACTGASEVLLDADGSDGSDGGFISAGERAEGEAESGELTGVPEALSSVDLDADTTTSTSTTTTSTTTTTVATTTSTTDPETVSTALEFTSPTSVAGAVAARTEGLGVITSPGDPLNVRSTPGVSGGIVSELNHQTTGITSTHIVDVNNAEWRFIELEGEPIGWVAGRFLQRDVSISFCTAPLDMPAGLVGKSPVQINIDDDAVLDTVSVLNEDLGEGIGRLWIRADLSGGGVIAGVTNEIAGPPTTPDLQVLFMTNSDALNFNSQFVVETFEGSARSDWTVFGLVGCEIEVTTLDRSPFTFNSGSLTNTTYGFGCIYGGENRFVTITDAQSTQTIDEFVLNGTAWTFETRTIADSGESEVPAGFTSCIEG